jgi:hypothetical protein
MPPVAKTIFQVSSFTGNPAPIGTLLVKLVEMDFSNHKEFSSFINHVGYSLKKAFEDADDHD